MGLEKDRATFYRQHRLRVMKATSFIDSSSPILHMGNYLKLGHMKEDANQYQRIMRHNVNLMISINAILRTGGRIQTFQKCNACKLQRSNLPHAISLAQNIDNKNFVFGRRLLCMKGELNTRRPLSEKNKKQRQETLEQFEVPKQILSKYNQLRLPKDINKLRHLLRPVIFFDISIAGIWALGRIVIQLYTEACPQVVLEFIRLCKSHNTERLKFVHLFPKLWLEGELRLEGKTLNTPKIEYDMRALDHGQSANVLSFAGHNLKGFRNGYINFAISFRPLSVLNGKRVGFGRVQKGSKLLNSLEEYGTKGGRPMNDIVVTHCGVL